MPSFYIIFAAMMKVGDITINTPLEVLNAFSENSLMEQLGILYTKVADGLVEGEMPVDKRTMQPTGILHGGASLAFAETLAGLGSTLIVDLEKHRVVGTQISGNHVGMALEGKVFGIATLVHKGRKTHVWNVDIKNEQGKLVSTVRATNMILDL